MVNAYAATTQWRGQGLPVSLVYDILPGSARHTLCVLITRRVFKGLERGRFRGRIFIVITACTSRYDNGVIVIIVMELLVWCFVRSACDDRSRYCTDGRLRTLSTASTSCDRTWNIESYGSSNTTNVRDMASDFFNSSPGTIERSSRMDILCF